LFKLGRASQGNVVKIIHQRVWEYLSEMGHRLWVHGFADTGLNGIVISRHLFFQMLSMCNHCCQLRTVLLALVVMSRNAIWVLEQPGNSLLAKHHRFEWMANHVAYVSWLRFMIEVAIVSLPTCSVSLANIGGPRYVLCDSGCNFMVAQVQKQQLSTAACGKYFHWIWAC